MRCLYCGKRLSLLRSFQKEEFCCEEHRSAFRAESDRLALQRLSEDRKAKSPLPEKPKKEKKQVITASDVFALMDPAAGTFLTERIDTFPLTHLQNLSCHPADPDLMVNLPEPAAMSGRSIARQIRRWLDGLEAQWPPELDRPAANDPGLCAITADPAAPRGEIRMPVARTVATEWVPPATETIPPASLDLLRFAWRAEFLPAAPTARMPSSDSDAFAGWVPHDVALPATAVRTLGLAGHLTGAGLVSWHPRCDAALSCEGTLDTQAPWSTPSPHSSIPRSGLATSFHWHPPEQEDTAEMAATIVGGASSIRAAIQPVALLDPGAVRLMDVSAPLAPRFAYSRVASETLQSAGIAPFLFDGQPQLCPCPLSAWEAAVQPPDAAPRQPSLRVKQQFSIAVPGPLPTETWIERSDTLAAHRPGHWYSQALPIPAGATRLPRVAAHRSSDHLRKNFSFGALIPDPALSAMVITRDVPAAPRYRLPLVQPWSGISPVHPFLPITSKGMRFCIRLKPALWVDSLRPEKGAVAHETHIAPLPPSLRAASKLNFRLVPSLPAPSRCDKQQPLLFTLRADRGKDSVEAQATGWKHSEPVLKPKLNLSPDPPALHGARKRRLEGWGPTFKAPQMARGFWVHIPSDIRWVALAIPLVLLLTWYSLTPRGKAFAKEGENPPIAKVDTSFFSRSMHALERSISQRAAVELSDDFRSGLAGWQGEGSWADGWSYDQAGFIRPGAIALLKASTDLSNYKFELLGSIDRRGFGWVYRAQDTRNYYAGKLVVVRPGPLPQIALQQYRVVNGKELDRRQVAIPISARNETVYRVRVDVEGHNFTTSVLGQVVDTYSDRTHAKGGVGLFASRGEAGRVRWVEVSHQYDMIGRLCAMLVPYGMANVEAGVNP